MTNHTLQTILKNMASKWQSCPLPPDETSVTKLIQRAGYALPEAYLTLLTFSNGPTGPLGIQPGWFQIWPAEAVMEYNRDYAVAEFLPGFFGFGSNGGDELLALDMRTSLPPQVFMVPFIPLQIDEAILIAKDFELFIQAMGQELEDNAL